MAADEPLIDVGVLTKGKPTLAMTLVTLLLQERVRLRLRVVDTADNPVIKQDDVLFALKLAQDRGVACEYEYSKERQRAFSVGRLRLLEALDGPHVCYVDDDVVLPSSALASLAASARRLGVYGYVAPLCVNAGASRGFLADRPHYSPGGLFHQDALVRSILLDYYSSTVDVLDAKGSASEKVWELAFLTELFRALGRVTVVQTDCVTYHLDYHRGMRWELTEEALLARSRAKVDELVAKHRALPAAARGSANGRTTAPRTVSGRATAGRPSPRPRRAWRTRSSRG